MDEMKVALCAIGRLENQYAVEFVEWYKKIGFDKIFIYDNNHDGEEYFEEVLQPFIDNEFVEITDYRDIDNAARPHTNLDKMQLVRDFFSLNEITDEKKKSI